MAAGRAPCAIRPGRSSLTVHRRKSRKQPEIQVSAAERHVAAIRRARRLIAGEVVNCQP
jgi:hypothetical protein